MTRKAEVYLRRYLALAERRAAGEGGGSEIVTTVADLAEVWDCSPRAVRETLARLEAWSLVRWQPRSGRGRRSGLRLLVHPVHVYWARAERAEQGGRLAEAAFWYAEILADCPCIPGVDDRLRALRGRLGLPSGAPPACCGAGGPAPVAPRAIAKGG